ncbi:MAG: hypothetical protein AAGK78_01380, partial [Planctomycetota bacterium]
MRGGGFLILSVLICVAIVLILYAAPIFKAPVPAGAGGGGGASTTGGDAEEGGGRESYLGALSRANKNAGVRANSFNGRDRNGRPANESAQYHEVPGRFNHLRVTEVDDGGALDTGYGLQAGDEIVQIGPHDL